MILGVAAIWDNRKGLEDFIKLQELLDEEYKIILVGLTSKQKQALPENIIGITRTNNVNELRELYAMADVFINPTMEDNYPTTNIESIACGTPVITYETGGSAESALIYGTSVPKKNLNSLVVAIQEVYRFKLMKMSIDYKNTVSEYNELYKKDKL